MSVADLGLDLVPVAYNTPWAHRSRGVIVNARKHVLGAFESTADAEAVVAAVNLIAEMRKPQP